jgi:LacI family transcriptional regulator
MVKSASIRSAVYNNIRNGRWKPGQQIPREKDLAREFGVCRVTVSNVLKDLDREGLFWSSRGKGRFVAKRPGKPRTRTIGVLIQDVAALTDWWSMRAILDGINAETAQTPYHLKILALNQNNDIPASRDWLNLEALDGMIVTTGSPHLNSLLAADHPVPMVCVDDRVPGQRVAIVELDWGAGAFQAIRHLADLGHRRIDIMHLSALLRTGQQCIDGARHAVMTHAAPNPIELRFHSASFFETLEEGRKLALSVLKQSPPPTAILCTADEFALPAYECLREAGLSVPEDVSLISFGGRTTREQIPVSLTACQLDFRQMGVEMVKTLCRMIENPSETPPPTRVPVELIVRESTRPPKGE